MTFTSVLCFYCHLKLIVGQAQKLCSFSSKSSESVTTIILLTTISDTVIDFEIHGCFTAISDTEMDF